MSNHREADEKQVKKPHTAHVNDSDTAKALLNDTQGKWLAQGTNGDMVQNLVKQGVLPEGANVIDFGKVKQSYGEDTAKLDQISKQAPADITKATGDVKTAQDADVAAQKRLDVAQKNVDIYAKPIDSDQRYEKQVQGQFESVTKALNKQSVNKDDLQKLVSDENQPQEVRDAAKGLLGTWIPTSSGRFHGVRNDYSKDGYTIDQKTLDAGKTLHDQWLSTARAKMAGFQPALDAAKAGKADADKNLDSANNALKALNKQNDQLARDQNDMKARVQAEHDAMTPVDKLGDMSKVQKGGGYYQVAEKLLGVDDKHLSSQQAKELKMLTKILQEESKALHNGQMPKYLKQNDVLLQPENIEHVFQRLNEIANPSPEK
ncbi:MAG TPA: hypothetical protein V6C97_30000 [Oculatellaceae cyanobacterium]